MQLSWDNNTASGQARSHDLCKNTAVYKFTVCEASCCSNTTCLKCLENHVGICARGRQNVQATSSTLLFDEVKTFPGLFQDKAIMAVLILSPWVCRVLFELFRYSFDKSPSISPLAQWSNIEGLRSLTRALCERPPSSLCKH